MPTLEVGSLHALARGASHATLVPGLARYQGILLFGENKFTITGTRIKSSVSQ